jgi:hypothetical protein
MRGFALFAFGLVTGVVLATFGKEFRRRCEAGDFDSVAEGLEDKFRAIEASA